jgi:hypothetical protein
MSGPSRGPAAFFTKTTMTNATTKAAPDYSAAEVADQVLETTVDQALVVFPEMEPIRGQLEALKPCSDRWEAAQEAEKEACKALDAMVDAIDDFIKSL